ncbi:MAG TPA: SRPBCC family protein [Gemmataceae bacterium]|nr:SRPBCC family protein [Gemmataceae bacterium]
MATFASTLMIARPIAHVFEFLCDPANLIEVTPPKYHMQLVQGPPRLHLGAVVSLQGRRWGVTQKIVSEITRFEPDGLIVDEQREGPFKKWVHFHHLEVRDQGTLMTDRIEFETPGGLIGLVMTEALVKRELEETFVYRQQRFGELLEGKS